MVDVAGTAWARPIAISVKAGTEQRFTVIPTKAGYRKLRELRRAGKTAAIRVRMRLTLTAADGRSATRTVSIRLVLKT